MMPAAYRPGSLLAKVRQDLAPLECEACDDTRALFLCEERGIWFLAEEQVEARFLMHLVTTRFSYRVPCGGGGPARIGIRHRGVWKRAGIECRADPGAEEVAQRLASDVALTSSILPLDFTDFQLKRHESGWDASLVHYGASEVVYQFPSTRQYVRLSRAQVKAILETFSRLNDLLGSGF